MNQVETVALWAGLIASIAGIVLSVTAMVVTVWIGRESAAVSQQMIKSLQKIESTVDHLSVDTRELITAAWNKMLSGFDTQPDSDADELDHSEQISAGIANEVRSELTEGAESGIERIDRIERTIEELRETLSTQLRRKSNKEPSGRTSALVETLLTLPIEARALVHILARGRHLTRKQYRAAGQIESLKPAIRKLRLVGLLVPLMGYDEGGEGEPCYYFPPGITNAIKVAVQLVGEIATEALESVSAALTSVGYTPRI